jgi:hypothetical protein
MDVYYEYNNPERVLERKVSRLLAKAEREYFAIGSRMTAWDYEDQLKKIDEYKKIWTKHNAKK